MSYIFHMPRRVDGNLTIVDVSGSGLLDEELEALCVRPQGMDADSEPHEWARPDREGRDIYHAAIEEKARRSKRGVKSDTKSDTKSESES